jgi:hypothetical protein
VFDRVDSCGYQLLNIGQRCVDGDPGSRLVHGFAELSDRIHRIGRGKVAEVRKVREIANHLDPYHPAEA